MVERTIIAKQLENIDVRLPFWLSPEIKQLSRIIAPNETIRHALNGRYEGGLALLCATDHRLLIIDKKPFFLSVEDLRYDMLAEVDFTHQLFDGTIHLVTMNKDVWFVSFKKKQLGHVTDYIHQKLSEKNNEYQKEMQALGDRFESSAPIPEYVTQSQAKEFLPTTHEAWDRVGLKMDRVNRDNYSTNSKNPTFIRHRVSKFYPY